jgi:hypothetical protein
MVLHWWKSVYKLIVFTEKLNERALEEMEMQKLI